EGKDLEEDQELGGKECYKYWNTQLDQSSRLGHTHCNFLVGTRLITGYLIGQDKSNTVLDYGVQKTFGLTWNTFVSPCNLMSSVDFPTLFLNPLHQSIPTWIMTDATAEDKTALRCTCTTKSEHSRTTECQTDEFAMQADVMQLLSCLHISLTYHPVISICGAMFKTLFKYLHYQQICKSYRTASSNANAEIGMDTFHRIWDELDYLLDVCREIRRIHIEYP
ncbi:hypothetical protein C0J52_10340, partial [Blattella germanica]